MNSWSLIYDHYEPEEEALREALCTVGNGYFCSRGAAPEATDDGTHYPGTYLAGGYNRLTTDIAGQTIENEDLVNLPNWLGLTFRIEGGDWFDLRQVKIIEFRQELDLKRGFLRRKVRFRDEQGRTTRLDQRRLVHMGNRHVAALCSNLVAEDWAGEIELCSSLDGRVINNNVERYRDLSNRHLEPIRAEQVDAESIFLKMRTCQSRIEIAMAARTRITVDDAGEKQDRQLEQEEDYIAQHSRVQVDQNREIRIEKIVTLFTSRDEAIAECGLEARKTVQRIGDFDALLQEQTWRWNQLWDRFDIKIEEKNGVERTRMILRLHIFHLLQSVSLHAMDLDIGVPARGWHGEAYRGHIFWDELFIFPLLNLRLPEITRTLLHYRSRRLPEARALARAAGYQGAMFPWQSGSNGREESQKFHLNPKSGNWLPDNSRLQRHVNAAIAYNVWQYYQVTGDMEYLAFYGAEIILEIARFWASMARWNKEIGRFEILGVMGPDEYHDAYPGADQPGLDNNAYTNIMAVWVLICAHDVLNILPDDRRRELNESLGLTEAELQKWDHISRSMRLIFHDDDIISQFEGYDQLAELDWSFYREKYGDVIRLDRVLEAAGDSPNNYKCSKQADVLMLFYLFSAEELGEIFQRLGYPFAYETIPKNIDYYIERTSHGSTLSQVVHSWVLARSNREASWELFNMALRSDIDDIQGGTTPEGIHLGAMAGTVDLIQRGSTGIETRGGVLRLNPCLPREIDNLFIRVRYRGQAIDLSITREKMTLAGRQCHVDPIKVAFNQEEHTLSGGETVTFNLLETRQ